MTRVDAGEAEDTKASLADCVANVTAGSEDRSAIPATTATKGFTAERIPSPSPSPSPFADMRQTPFFACLQLLLLLMLLLMGLVAHEIEACPFET